MEDRNLLPAFPGAAFCASRIWFLQSYTGCAKKVTPFWYLSFLPSLDALFAIFVYLHIIFIKCLISEPSVVSMYRWTHQTPAGWCTIAHCEKHDKLPQKENVSFIEPQMWPPNSPDLNPVDYAVWGALQQQV